jgi:hypothetical protein
MFTNIGAVLEKELMRIYSASLILGLAIFGGPLPVSQLIAGVTLSFAPQNQKVALGGTASVDIKVDGIGVNPFVGGFDITVLFDNTILGKPTVAFGNGLGTPPSEALTGSTPLAGSVEFFEISFLDPTTLSELQFGLIPSFTLATLKVPTTALGTSPLSMTNVTLGDPNGDPITFDTGTGQITVVTPEPGTMMLFAVAVLVFLVGTRRGMRRFAGRWLALLAMGCVTLPAQQPQKICVSLYRYGGAASPWTAPQIMLHINLASTIFLQNASVQWTWDQRIVEDLVDPFGQRNGDIADAPTTETPIYSLGSDGSPGTGSRDLDYILRVTAASECYPVVFVNGGLGDATGLTYVTPIGQLAARSENPNITCRVNGQDVACLAGVVTLIDISSFPKAEDPNTKRMESKISTLAHEFGHALCLDPDSNPQPPDPAIPRWGDSTHHPPRPNPANPIANPPGNADPTKPDTPEGAGFVVGAGFNDKDAKLRFDLMWFTGPERSGDETFTQRQSVLANFCAGLLRGRYSPTFSVAPNGPSGLSETTLHYAPAPPMLPTPSVSLGGLVAGDDVNGISYDRRQLLAGRYAFHFTVDAASTGAARTAIAAFADHSASEFAAPIPVPAGGNTPVLGSAHFGLMNNDQIDALEPLPPSVVDPARFGFVRPLVNTSSRLYFTVAAGGTTGLDASTIYTLNTSTDAMGNVTGGAAPYALPNQLGLGAGDQIGSMCVVDNGNGIYDSNDTVFFTLKRGSPTLAGINKSAADIFQAKIPAFPNPPPPPGGQVGGFIVAQDHSTLGLAAGDQITALKCFAAPRKCDVNFDGKVNIDDIQAIADQRNTTAAPGDPLDVNGDGKIDVNDARICTLLCDKPNCAR